MISSFDLKNFAEALNNREVEVVDYKDRKIVGKIKSQFKDKFGGTQFTLTENISSKEYKTIIQQQISQSKFFGPLTDLQSNKDFVQKQGVVLPIQIKQTAKLPVGESSTYEVKMFGMTAGTIELNTLPHVQIGTKVYYHWQVKLKTAPGFGRFYRLDNQASTYVSFDRLWPHSFRMSMNEEKKFLLQEGWLDHENQRLQVWEKGVSVRHGEVDSKNSFAMDPGTQNVVSALFYLRLMDLKNKKDFWLQDRSKRIQVFLEEKGKEKVKANDAERMAQKYQVLAKVDGKKTKLGKIFVWLSEDPLPLLLRIEAGIKIGKIKARLAKFQPGG